MGFVVPQMPLGVNIWNSTLVTNAPTISTVCNLSPGRRTFFAGPVVTTNITLGALIVFGDLLECLLPKGTDIRGAQHAGLDSIVECPKGTGRYYYVVWVDDVAKGFANEYRLALMKQCDLTFVSLTNVISVFGNIPVWPVPTP